MRRTSMAPGAGGFTVPGGFDYGRSTKEQYTLAPGVETPFRSEFEEIRETLDADYHGVYTPARQIFQVVSPSVPA